MHYYDGDVFDLIPCHSHMNMNLAYSLLWGSQEGQIFNALSSVAEDLIRAFSSWF